MKKTLIGIVIFVLISTTNLFAQNERIDSLKQKLANTPESQAFEINFQLAREYSKFNDSIALEFAKKAKSLAILNQDSFSIVKSLRLSGTLLMRIDKLDSSVNSLQKALPIADRNHFEEESSTILNTLGLDYVHLSKYDKALHHLMLSLALREKIGKKSSIPIVLNNIGFVYYKLLDYKMSLSYYSKAYAIKIENNDNYQMDLLLINISLCHLHLGDLAEARRLLQPTIEKCHAKWDDLVFVTAMHASGLIWLRYDSLNRAEKEFLQSYAVAKRSSNHRFIFDDIIALSEIYLKKGDLISSEKFLLEGEQMTKESHLDREKMRLFEQLCALQKVIGDYYKLSFYNQKYIQMKDSVSSTTKTNNLMGLHAEALEKENKTQLASQEQTLHLKEEIINKQLRINILIGFAIALLAFLIYVLMKIFQQRKEANYLLNKKVLERSDELLQNQQSLKLAIEQRNNALTKLSENLNNSIESMRSLCVSGTKMENDLNALRYFDEISSTTSNLSICLQSILP